MFLGVNLKSVDLAYAKRLPYTIEDGVSIIGDMLYVYVSKNCGESWIKRGQWNTNELNTKGDSIAFNPYVPLSSDWEERSVNIQTAAEEESVIIKFVFTGKGILQEEEAFNVDNGTIITDNIGGNWLYIDNLRVGENFVNLTEEQSLGLRVFPNPSNGSAKIEINLNSPEKVFIELHNILGKVVTTKEFDLQKGINTLKLEDIHANVPTGNYLINVITNKEMLSNSIIITK